jgi:hypothetical protein
MNNTDKLTVNGRATPAANFAAIFPGCHCNCYFAERYFIDLAG